MVTDQIITVKPTRKYFEDWKAFGVAPSAAIEKLGLQAAVCPISRAVAVALGIPTVSTVYEILTGNYYFGDTEALSNASVSTGALGLPNMAGAVIPLDQVSVRAFIRLADDSQSTWDEVVAMFGHEPEFEYHLKGAA